jgi:hypothetical protein
MVPEKDQVVFMALFFKIFGAKNSGFTILKKRQSFLNSLYLL